MLATVYSGYQGISLRTMRRMSVLRVMRLRAARSRAQRSSIVAIQLLPLITVVYIEDLARQMTVDERRGQLRQSESHPSWYGSSALIEGESARGAAE